MTLREAMEHRHSVRNYLDKPLDGDVLDKLRKEIDDCNRESGLSFRLIGNNPEAFHGFLPHYGGFRNVKNYIACAGPDNDALEEKCGYFGERLVLFAEQNGLSTCWVGGTFNKRETHLNLISGDRLCLIIAVGYAAVEGKPHRSRGREQFYTSETDVPEWFLKGIEAVMLAPSAVNMQRFRFIYHTDGSVSASAGKGPFAKVDLGIAKLHFEIGADKDESIWSK